eukprot:TRINITY_DN73660_c0_g1_i1.p2 TRINITY_DN73660_c0_g1~~TRINITY_DN73660_c0_g1_i1.p2  ORF type:complete len:102 (+),score=3.79 TRINITY_DN73660_c0_g1_i1:31-306(+)
MARKFIALDAKKGHEQNQPGLGGAALDVHAPRSCVVVTMQAPLLNGRPAIRASNNTASKVCMKGSSKCYHVEITVNDRERKTLRQDAFARP